MAAELEKDIAELEKLQKIATRGNVETFLEGTIQQWKLKLDSLRANETSSAAKQSSVNGTSGSSFIRPVKSLTTYAYDETDKFVKLYYTIEGCTAQLPPEKIMPEIGTDAFHIRCVDIGGVDYAVTMKGLLHPIDPEKSVVKPKTDSLLVMLKKKREGEKWGAVLKLEKPKNTKVPKFDDNADPQESMMKMMKQMYDEGDDEMKRTMRKSWYEGQTKQRGTGGPEMGDL